ncbi:MAG: hypothetical protein Unbinned5079contig1000_42 [Prokaryotic dsDNA virus sp.]|nr:MAG: hypothetical protein Unbinned5079contig1000_42 [Prokaryotic dsDNA virus sp.]|tara:strand:- start:9808 stop:10266 length:459 start_codon:yes stop_codon:yes gene_type:complete
MVDPVTIAAGASAVSGMMGYKGNMASAKSMQQTAEFNAGLAENESVLLARAKRDEEVSLRRQSNRLVGTQRLMTAASGVQISGSPLQALFDTYASTEMDAAMIQYASNQEQVQKQSEAALMRAEGGARSASAKYQAYTSLLSGGSKAATLMS